MEINFLSFMVDSTPVTVPISFVVSLIDNRLKLKMPQHNNNYVIETFTLTPPIASHVANQLHHFIPPKALKEHGEYFNKVDMKK